MTTAHGAPRRIFLIEVSYVRRSVEEKCAVVRRAPWFEPAQGVPNGAKRCRDVTRATEIDRTNEKKGRQAQNSRRRRRRRGAGQRVYHTTAFSEPLIDFLVRRGLLPDIAEHSDEQIEQALTLWVDSEIRK